MEKQETLSIFEWDEIQGRDITIIPTNEHTTRTLSNRDKTIQISLTRVGPHTFAVRLVKLESATGKLLVNYLWPKLWISREIMTAFGFLPRNNVPSTEAALAAANGADVYLTGKYARKLNHLKLLYEGGTISILVTKGMKDAMKLFIEKT